MGAAETRPTGARCRAQDIPERPNPQFDRRFPRGTAGTLRIAEFFARRSLALSLHRRGKAGCAVILGLKSSGKIYRRSATGPNAPPNESTPPPIPSPRYGSRKMVAASSRGKLAAEQRKQIWEVRRFRYLGVFTMPNNHIAQIKLSSRPTPHPTSATICSAIRARCGRARTT